MKSPASGSGNVRKPYADVILRKIARSGAACVSVFCVPDRWGCRYSSARVAAVIV
jgi:hypothetical protein